MARPAPRWLRCFQQIRDQRAPRWPHHLAAHRRWLCSWERAW